MPIGRRGPFTLQIGSTSKTDMAERAAEILTLTKMNWNSATFHMNDIVSFPFTGWNPAAYEQALRDEFDQLYEEGAHRRRMMVTSLHDRISGHAGGYARSTAS